jgi:hypothetical protein
MRLVVTMYVRFALSLRTVEADLENALDLILAAPSTAPPWVVAHQTETPLTSYGTMGDLEMRGAWIIATASAFLLCGCGPGGKATETAQATPSGPGGGATCPIISASDVSAAYGAKVSDRPANSLPQAQSCEFDGPGATVVRLQVVPDRYYEEHRGEGFRSVTGLGDKASISFELGGWRAIARQRDKAVVVMTDGPGAKPENTLAVLKVALAKL